MRGSNVRLSRVMTLISALVVQAAPVPTSKGFLALSSSTVLESQDLPDTSSSATPSVVSIPYTPSASSNGSFPYSDADSTVPASFATLFFILFFVLVTILIFTLWLTYRCWWIPRQRDKRAAVGGFKTDRPHQSSPVPAKQRKTPSMTSLASSLASTVSIPEAARLAPDGSGKRGRVQWAASPFLAAYFPVSQKGSQEIEARSELSPPSHPAQKSPNPNRNSANTAVSETIASLYKGPQAWLARLEAGKLSELSRRGDRPEAAIPIQNTSTGLQTKKMSSYPVLMPL